MYRILAIEDSVMLQRMIINILTHEGFEVLTASNVELGLKECAEKKPDLILLDVNLPDGSGIDLCRQLKADPRHRHIPVILLSGESISVEYRVEGLETGAEDYIIKPFDYKELTAKIRNLLRSAVRPTQS